jgi:hypothetical protein
LLNQETERQRKIVKDITQKQADLIAMIHETLQGGYGEQSRTLLRNSLLAWAKKLKRRARPESNKSRKKNAKSSRSSKDKKKSNK